jgi:hypothetical protein
VIIGGQQVPHAVRAGVGGPPSAPRRQPTTGSKGPLPARVRLEVERPELIDADDCIWVARLGIDGAVHQAVQVQDPVLLGLEVWIAGLLPGLDHLKGHALLAEQHPQAFVADVVDHPLSDQELGQLRERPGRKRQAMVDRPGQGELGDPLGTGPG